ncbi:unnamed protein product, partial [Didymodactylos carnosus]
EEHPDVDMKLKYIFKEETGLPSAEENQPKLLSVKEEIASIGTVAQQRHSEVLRPRLILDDLVERLKSYGLEINDAHCITVDGGPDENPRFPKTLLSATDVVKTHQLGTLYTLTHASGQSAYNPVKTTYSVVAQFAEHRDRDAEGDLQDFDESWRSRHVLQTQYTCQIVFCDNVGCCDARRSNYIQVFPHRFLPAPLPFERNAEDFALAKHDNGNTAFYGSLFQRLSLKRFVTTSLKNDVKGFLVVSVESQLVKDRRHDVFSSTNTTIDSPGIVLEFYGIGT